MGFKIIPTRPLKKAMGKKTTMVVRADAIMDMVTSPLPRMMLFSTPIFSAR